MLFLNLDDHLVEHVLGHLVLLEVGKEGTEAEGRRNIFRVDRSNPGPERYFLTLTSSVTNLESRVITTSVTLSLSLQVVYTMSLSCGQVNTTTTGATER